jgi:hypothetical protein
MIAPFVEDWLLPLQWKYRNSYSSKVRSPVVCQPRRVSTEEDADFSFDRRKGMIGERRTSHLSHADLSARCRTDDRIFSSPGFPSTIRSRVVFTNNA